MTQVSRDSDDVTTSASLRIPREPSSWREDACPGQGRPIYLSNYRDMRWLSLFDTFDGSHRYVVGIIGGHGAPPLALLRRRGRRTALPPRRRPTQHRPAAAESADPESRARAQGEAALPYEAQGGAHPRRKIVPRSGPPDPAPRGSRHADRPAGGPRRDRPSRDWTVAVCRSRRPAEDPTRIPAPLSCHRSDPSQSRRQRSDRRDPRGPSPGRARSTAGRRQAARRRDRDARASRRGAARGAPPRRVSAHSGPRDRRGTARTLSAAERAELLRHRRHAVSPGGALPASRPRGRHDPNDAGPRRRRPRGLDPARLRPAARPRRSGIPAAPGPGPARRDGGDLPWRRSVGDPAEFSLRGALDQRKRGGEDGAVTPGRVLVFSVSCRTNHRLPIDLTSRYFWRILPAPMPVWNFVRTSFYQDSVTLMRLTRDLESLAGVQRAYVMMGTPENRRLLREAALLTAPGRTPRRRISSSPSKATMTPPPSARERLRIRISATRPSPSPGGWAPLPSRPRPPSCSSSAVRHNCPWIRP